MYTNTVGANYINNKPSEYSRTNSYSILGYSSTSDNYKSLISESKCRCRGTCRTGIGCTCK